MQSALISSGYLTIVLTATWLLLAGPAYLTTGLLGVEGLTYACLVCLAPGLMVIALSHRPRLADHPLAAPVIGFSLRIFVVVLAVLAICLARPDLRITTFLVWVVPFYLVGLVVETWLALRQRPSIAGSPPREMGDPSVVE